MSIFADWMKHKIANINGSESISSLLHDAYVTGFRDGCDSIVRFPSQKKKNGKKKTGLQNPYVRVMITWNNNTITRTTFNVTGLVSIRPLCEIGPWVLDRMKELGMVDVLCVDCIAVVR